MSEIISADILVIGAGPAGIGAALEAARSGAKTVIIDSFGEAGGQFWMQPLADTGQCDRQRDEGAKFVAECRRLGVSILTDTEVWGILPGYRVFIQSETTETAEISAKALVVCTGAHDLVMPFAGWTLPGVMTAGAGQRYTKLYAKPPGSKIVLAGTGIFLWAVAATIVKSGGNLVSVIEANSNRLRTISMVCRHPERWRETWELVSPVIRAGVRLIYGHRVESATGMDRISSVTLQNVSNDKINTRQGQVLETDCLLVSHGFRPITEITALLRCEHQFSLKKGGWYCKTDPETGSTSINNVYAAGEITGIAGAKSALVRGAIAGLEASSKLGFSRTGLGKRKKELRKRHLKAQKFADELADLFEIDKNALPTPPESLVVCRCEGVTWGEVLNAWNDGSKDMQGIKLWTRVGMGRCQGRICGTAISYLLATRFRLDQAQFGFNRPRLPLRPIPLNLAHDAFTGRQTAYPETSVGPQNHLR